MKFIQLSIIFFCFVFCNPLWAQKNIDQVLRKYKNDEGVVNMNFTGEVLKKFNESKEKIKSTVDNVDIVMFKSKEDISSSDKLKIKELITREKYDLLVDVKNKDQKVKLYAKENGNFLSHVFAQVNYDDMNIYFMLSGNIIFEELAKLGMDFQSADGLKVLGKSSNKSKK
jgi:Domain of unknown function (DUF4252)